MCDIKEVAIETNQEPSHWELLIAAMLSNPMEVVERELLFIREELANEF